MNDKEYNIFKEKTIWLKTLLGKFCGIKSCRRKKECKTYLFLPLIHTFINEALFFVVVV